MTQTAQDVIESFNKSLDEGQKTDTPYNHWVLTGCLPGNMAEELKNLPFEAPSLDGVSGTREVHNKTRKYFDVENRGRFQSVAAIAEAFQGAEITGKIQNYFGIDIKGSYLRMEYAQDTDGFWLEPHTDLGVKLFTMLLYLSDEEGHENLGTDIYKDNKEHVGRSPFAPNTAMVFIPSDNTYHGFEARPIKGVRKSVIINYVTDEWRAREQLAFPENQIS